MYKEMLAAGKLEDEINELQMDWCFKNVPRRGIFSIVNWEAQTLPWWFKIQGDSNKGLEDLDKLYYAIDQLIRVTPLEVCLASDSPYIKETRKWWKQYESFIQSTKDKEAEPQPDTKLGSVAG